MRYLFLCLFCLHAFVFAKERVATRETAVKGNRIQVDSGEMSFITETFRSAALNVLDNKKYHIMTKDNILVMPAPGKQLSDCLGECIVETGKNVGAHFVTQGVLSMVGTRFSFTSSLYETQKNQLVSFVNALAKTKMD